MDQVWECVHLCVLMQIFLFLFQAFSVKNVLKHERGFEFHTAANQYDRTPCSDSLLRPQQDPWCSTGRSPLLTLLTNWGMEGGGAQRRQRQPQAARLLEQLKASKFGYIESFTVKLNRTSTDELASKKKWLWWEIAFPVFIASLQSWSQHCPWPTDKYSKNISAQPCSKLLL